MESTNFKGTSPMKIHHELGIPQRAAWHMLQTIREAFGSNEARLATTSTSMRSSSAARSETSTSPRGSRLVAVQWVRQR